MTLYSAGGGSFVQAPTWEEADKKFREALKKLLQVADNPEAVDQLTKNRISAGFSGF